MPCSSAVDVVGTTRSPSRRTMPRGRQQVADGAGARHDRARPAVDGDGDVATRARAAEHLGDDAHERSAARDDERGEDQPTPQAQRAPMVRDRRAVRAQLRVRRRHGQGRELRLVEHGRRLGLELGLDRRRLGCGGRPREHGDRLGRSGRGADGLDDRVRGDRHDQIGRGRRLRGPGEDTGEEGVLVLGRPPEVGLELGQLTVEVDRALLELEQLELAGEVERGDLGGQVDREPSVRLGRLLAGGRRLHRAQRVAPRPCVDAREPRVAASQVLADRVRLPVLRPHSASAG